MNHVAVLESALQRLTHHLDADPHQPRVYIQRGMTYFKLGHIAAAITDFDRAEHLNPALTPYLWQRGLAYYYAERFADGARQFEVDLTVNTARCGRNRVALSVSGADAGCTRGS